MCFSATASFSSSAILAGAGLLALSKANSPLERPFAAIPLLFAAQQFAEGCLWLGMGSGHDSGVRISTYIFLFFAQILWPVWIPISLMYMETDPIRKKLLMPLCAIGGSLSIYMAACLIVIGSRADIVGHHIFYSNAYPVQFAAISNLAYGLTTIVPPLVSGIRQMWILGIAIAAAYLFTSIFYGYYTTSVWCYCAAMLSTVVIWILVTMNRPATIADGHSAAVLKQP